MVSDDIVEPWRCESCNVLIHNIEYGVDGSYPVPGAPPASFGTIEYPRVCKMCRGMLDVLEDNPYFSKLHKDRKDYVDRMKNKFREN